MKYRAITTCNFDQWCRYGLRMAKTFVRNWPEDIVLRVYAEGFEGPPDMPAEFCSLQVSSPWLTEFKASYNQPVHRGRANGIYNYLFDAVKFSHKVAAIGAAAEKLDCDVLIWIDADVVTHAPVTKAWLEELFPAAASLAWLDRSYKHLECGFLMFRMPAALPVIQNMCRIYQTGDVFKLQHWTDCHVIERAGRKAAKRGEIIIHSLSGDKVTFRHPFISGRLGECMDHLKGERKAVGRSPTTDLKTPRSEPYWQ